MEKGGEVVMKTHHASEVCTNVAHHLIMLFLIQSKSTKSRDKSMLKIYNIETFLNGLIPFTIMIIIIKMLLGQKQFMLQSCPYVLTITK